MPINEPLRQAVNFHQQGQLQEAERLYRYVLHIQANQPDANHNLGLIAVQLGQPASALPHLQTAWKIDPHNEQYCLSLTDCLLRMNRSGDALRIIKNAVQRKGFNSAQTTRLLQLATRIASAERPELATERELADLFAAGRFSMLEQRLSLLLDQYPNWGEGWNVLCTTQQLLGKNYEDALQRSITRMPAITAAVSRKKVFCIGANKTGTTTLESVFGSLGLIVGSQEQAELFLHDWARQDYRRIIRYCESAEAFQDVPFSFHGAFRAMDEAFPGSKFILTVRNTADEWFESLVRFHTGIIGKGRIPTADDLKQFSYRYPGFLWDSFQMKYGVDESKLYDRDVYVRWYEEHNHAVQQYFEHRPDDLLTLNVAEPDAMERLLGFLGYPYTGQKMPHLNSSRD